MHGPRARGRAATCAHRQCGASSTCARRPAKCTELASAAPPSGATGDAGFVRLSKDRIAYGMDLAQATRGGILLHRDLLSGGLSAAAIHRLVSQGTLVRLRRGAYTTPDAAADRDDRYRLSVIASMALGDVHRVAAHWSAGALTASR